MLRTVAVFAVFFALGALAAEPGTPNPPPGGAKPSAQPGAKPGAAPPPGQPGQPPPAAPLTGKELNDALYALGLDLGRNIAPFQLTKAELDLISK